MKKGEIISICIGSVILILGVVFLLTFKKFEMTSEIIEPIKQTGIIIP